jgi:hypothetical protein
LFAKRLDKRRGLVLEQFEQRILFAIAPTLVSIQPNEGDVLLEGQIRSVAPRELTLRFDDGQILDQSTVNANSIQVRRSGGDGVFGNANDALITHVYVAIGEKSNEVIVRFADNLPDDFYQVTIVGAGASALKNTAGLAFNNGTDLTRNFRLDLGAQVLAVVPQPVDRGASGLTQATDTIIVYFNDDRLASASAQNPVLYQLIDTKGTVQNTDDVVRNPSSVVYEPNNNRAILRFSGGIAPGTYRLRIGDDTVSPGTTTLPTIQITPPTDPGSSLTTAADLGTLGAQSVVILGQAIDHAISPTNAPYNLQWPGGIDEPGHRDIPAETHLNGGADSNPGITVYYYNFKRHYGNDPQGNPLTNLITETQKQRTREIFELYGKYLGVQFIESDDQGFTIATGDPRALDPSVPTGPTGVGGIAGGGVAIMNNGINWNNSFGGSWFTTAMHEIGHLLGLGHAYELPPLTIMGSSEDAQTTSTGAEPVFPGDADIVHGLHLYRLDSKDIDFYRFQLGSAGRFSAEIIAERLTSASLLDSVLTLYDATGRIIARNDDYFGKDSFVDLALEAGTYYIAVASTGNIQNNPNVADSGLGGNSEGPYKLRLTFNPVPSGSVLVDATGTRFDGDADGRPGGIYNFWFQAGTQVTAGDDATNLRPVIFVDKSAPTAGANGTLAHPFNNIQAAFTEIERRRDLLPIGADFQPIVRIVGNGGADGNIATLGDNLAYEIGKNIFNQALSDGEDMNVPEGTTVMIDAGAIFKLRGANINVGTFQNLIDLSHGALQVLGTPARNVIFTSYDNETVGKDTNPLKTTPAKGDWGGIVFRADSDREDAGIFLNYVSNAHITYAGGSVVVDSIEQVFTPIYMESARPTIINNTILASANAVISADPNSFEERLFRSDTFTADYRRAGPEVHGTILTDGPGGLEENSINGFFIRIRTEAGVPIDTLDVPARLTDTDIVYVITENLFLNGNPGGPRLEGGVVKARSHGRLAIDPGIIVKLQGSRIEVGMSGIFIAEGNAGNRVVFTSLLDDRYGASGVFDTTNDGAGSLATPGDWGGISYDAASRGSLDHVLVTFAGGTAPIEGGFARFNALEIRQSEVRVANSVLERNADGFDATDRNGRASNAAATIFVRGAQPIIVNNIIRNNDGDAININANSLNTRQLPDYGRSTGPADLFNRFDDNYGPLVRLNRMDGNDINGMAVRGGTLTTESIWDDTDIVHVVREEIAVPNLHVYGGLRLKSSITESLVVKLNGSEAGFTASGTPLDIDDRIGGTLQVLGTPGHPVILTSLTDETVGAGFDLNGQPQTKTFGGGEQVVPWRGLKLDRYSNDRNVDVVNELESAYTGANDTNNIPTQAQFLGTLAADEKNGDDVRRLGFEIHGSISYDRPGDVDVYSFNGVAGTEVWFDIDRTSTSLDTVIELLRADGVVLARSTNSTNELLNPNLLFSSNGTRVFTMPRSDFSGGDLYTINPRDAGMRLILPGTAGTTNTYYVRVRSNSNNLNNLTGGQTSGNYQLQIRLREVDEFPGSTVRFADIRNAINGIDIEGLPGHSPLVSETSRAPTLPIQGTPNFANVTFNSAQDVGNLLATDRNTIAIASLITAPQQIDWYKFTLDYQDIQSIGGYSDSGKTWSTIFDIDYADGMSRPNLTISIFDSLGNLLYVGRDSNISDDQPTPIGSQASADLSRGSFGKLDAFIGSIQLPEGTSKTFYVAVSSDAMLPVSLNQTYQDNAFNKLVRLEPVNSIKRIVEDHIGFTGYQSEGNSIQPTTGPILPISDPIQLRTNILPFQLSDVGLFVSSSIYRLSVVDPVTGRVESDIGLIGWGGLPGSQQPGERLVTDIAMRSDGLLYAAQASGDVNDNFAGYITLVDTGDGTGFDVGTDAIPDTPENGATQQDQISSTRVEAIAYERLRTPADSSLGKLEVYDVQTSNEHYGLWLAVTDRFGNSHLFLARPDDANAKINNGQPWGPAGADQGRISNVPPDPNTGQYLGNVIGTVTGMAFTYQQGISLFAPSASQILDGQIFSITDATHTVTFEFNRAGGIGAGRIAVDITGTESASEVAQKIAAAIATSDLNILAQQQGNVLLLINAVSGSRGNSAVQFSDLPNEGKTLYGVDNRGHFFKIRFNYWHFWDQPDDVVFSPPLAYDVITLASDDNTPWAGLTLAPQNVDLDGDGKLGDLKFTLFAITTTGDLYAIDTLTNTFRMDIFKDENGNPVNHVSTFLSGVTGLAFAPLDFNLWHPTTQGGTDPGHGILPAPDHSRDSLTPEQLAGGASYYFGLENYDGGYLPYVQMTEAGLVNVNTQWGITTVAQQADLTAYRANLIPLPAVIARMSPADQDRFLIGNNYNLPGGAYGSLVTNSFSLEGYDAADKPTLYFNYFLETENAGGDAMRDSARVFISFDDGRSWQMLATNNSTLDKELPKYISASSNTASGDARQRIQELFDTVKQDDGQGNLTLDNRWRQARVDLSDFAGYSNLKLRFDFSTAGTIRDPNSRGNYGQTLPGDQFGAFGSNTKGQKNNFKGFYIDDIIIGFAERGEMVTQPPPGIPGVPVPQPDPTFFPVPQNLTPGAPSQVLVGAYQLEIRRGTEYAANISGINEKIAIYRTFDTNDRQTRAITLVAPSGASLVNGQKFIISDGVNAKTFEFRSSGSPASGNVAVSFSPGDSAAQVAKRIRDAINAQNGPSFQVSASSITTSNRIDLVNAQRVNTGGTPTLQAIHFDNLGDRNLQREQGMVVIQNTTIINAGQYGILAKGSARDANGSHPGSAANLRELNTSRLAPGVVLENNLIVGSGLAGIKFSGDPNAPIPGPNPDDPPTFVPLAVVPFGRILNNTIYGGGSGIGILVSDNASPTLLNNILSSLDIGVSVDATSATTVLGANLYQDNKQNTVGTTLGSFPIVLTTGEPLFVNAPAGNFRLAAGSRAIDSSLNTLQDRPAMTTVLNPLGINPSPIIVPSYDLFGRLRVDDPTMAPPPGLGSNVFKDRGAIDRSDFVGPTAALVNPPDNDNQGLDQNPAPNEVFFAGGSPTNFSIQLNDGTGSGIDLLTVTGEKFVLKRDGVQLVEGVDYVFGYDTTNNIARFTPLVGVWLSGHTYTITVDNSAATGIHDLSGNPLAPNRLSGETLFIIDVKEVDFGDAPDPSYPTLLENDGARHIIVPGFQLGQRITNDPNGRQSAAADGDEGDDGVVFNTPFVPGKTATITVTASAAGKLDAWIDWDGDGIWAASEQVFQSRGLSAGANTLTINVPATTQNFVFARFRLSSAGGLSPVGLAEDGEVEDYRIAIPPVVAYTIELVNPTTGQPIAKDADGNYVVVPGMALRANVYVTDTRDVGALGGVFAAFADLTYDVDAIDWVAGSLVIGSDFPNLQSGAINEIEQVIDEAGGIDDLTPTGAGIKRLLFRVDATVKTSAALGSSFVLALNQADLSPIHDTLVYGLDLPVSASYQSVNVQVSAHPWTNPNPFLKWDVNNDGIVSGLDAILIINRINAGLGLPAPPATAPPYYDVSGNNVLSAQDAIMVINYINGAPRTKNDTAGTTAGAPVAINVLANDTDPNSPLDPTTVVIVSDPLHGSVEVDPVTGVVTYTPTAGFVGSDSFRYRVTDKPDIFGNTYPSNVSTVNVTVTAGLGPLGAAASMPSAAPLAMSASLPQTASAAPSAASTSPAGEQSLSSSAAPLIESSTNAMLSDLALAVAATSQKATTLATPAVLPLDAIDVLVDSGHRLIDLDQSESAAPENPPLWDADAFHAAVAKSLFDDQQSLDELLDDVLVPIGASK